MIELFEKILWGLSGLALIALGAAFYLLGAPSDQPLIALQAVEQRKDEFVKQLDQGARDSLESQLEEGLQKISTSGSSRSGRANADQKFTKINRAMYERFRSRNDALYEAKQVSSEIVEVNGQSALKLTEIPESSPLRKLGFEQDDVITSIGNIDIDFESAASADNAFLAAKQVLESGNPLVITLQRGPRKRAQQIAISLSDLQ